MLCCFKIAWQIDIKNREDIIHVLSMTLRFNLNTVEEIYKVAKVFNKFLTITIRLRDCVTRKINIVSQYEISCVLRISDLGLIQLLMRLATFEAFSKTYNRVIGYLNGL